MRVNDLVLAVLVLAGACVLAGAAWTLPPIPGQHYGAAVFPLAIAGGLFLCGVVLGLGALRGARVPFVTRTWAAEPGAAWRVAATLSAIIFYMLAAPSLGFIATSALVLLGLFLLLGVRLPVAAAAAGIASLCVFYAFAHLLRVPLPHGLVEGWL
ncbi:tripartite tricarboxylate transporter TctB family protein [Aquabacter spiritensis]|uniref:Putative tricarboxylic transport membrane protein n=1 Tax=Aquabacter spiritensis TaxID=933073 RepID=A0A4V2UY94_9HYPH|nr:tripartite tricarboxylate transporter TctB family protein [Aquabacter spiritensis]TCT06588.1 putative tricarboxylic transport membrane protein [Aquabacter spiritensis]